MKELPIVIIGFIVIFILPILLTIFLHKKEQKNFKKTGKTPP